MKQQAAQVRPRGKSLVLFLSLAFVVGAVSTGHWLGGMQFPVLEGQLFTAPALLAGATCVLLTSGNLLLRWFRWHFLIRRFTPHLITRDSVAVYLATLPALLSPFFIAELGRVFLIRRRYQAPASYLVRVWFIERFLDFFVVFCALLYALSTLYSPLQLGLPFPITLSTTTVVVLMGAVAGTLLFRGTLATRSWGTTLAVSATAVLLTILAWALPVVALHSVLTLLGAPISWSIATQTFAQGTVFGGITGLPLGVHVTGSTMIEVLLDSGIARDASVVGVLVYRSGTAIYAVLLGLAAIFLFRRRLSALIRGETEAHFDEIASEYQAEIPEHVRERLLGKKVGLMQRTLSAHAIGHGSRGLDLGCGQGWYLGEMRQLGYDVEGTDYSKGQLEKAQVHLSALGLKHVSLVQADAQALPFADASFDFVYSVNAIHHILAEGAQQRALREIVRILRPGGVFLLHEINTYNPVFRWYMGYVFPLLKRIDEGNEEWILPTALPDVPGAHWEHREVEYFTFLPDFVPRWLLQLFAPLERMLEDSPFKRLSAHYQACLVKSYPPAATP